MSILSRLTPYSYSVASTPEDPRLGQLIGGLDRLEEADIVIFGVPTDEGIRINGGRVGAAQAPDRIRQQLAKLTPFAGPSHRRQISDLKIVDLGNVMEDELPLMHDIAQEITSKLVSKNKFVIALGGGHDVTYPLVKGFAERYKNVSLVNVDAHLDVRPKKNGRHHSGSSFRLLLEEHIVQHIIEFGIHPHVIASNHVYWLKPYGNISYYDDIIDARREFVSAMQKLGASYVSFDIDAIRASDAPGVSAPAPYGFSSQEAMQMCFEAGKFENVRMIDLVEVSPPHDVDDRTSRLVARMIANAMLGFANR
jgi:formimidoylglutamase